MSKGRSTRRWALLVVALLALILVPFVLVEEPLLAWSRGLLAAPSRLGAGLAVAMLLALDVLLPIPSSLVSTASDALLGFAKMSPARFLLITTAKNVCILAAILTAPGIDRPSILGDHCPS